MDIAHNPAPDTYTATVTGAAANNRAAAGPYPAAVAVLHAIPVPRHRAVKSKGWASPGSSASPAYISLSRDHVALLKTTDGRLLTPIDLGQMELSTRQAWDTAADALLSTQKGRIEFTVRNATFALGDTAPRGLEVRGGTHPPAAWLAHPRTFSVLHTHFTDVLSPQTGLVFVTRDHKELFVLDADAHEVKERFPRAAVFTYSLGFPINHRGPKQ